MLKLYKPSHGCQYCPRLVHYFYTSILTYVVMLLCCYALCSLDISTLMFTNIPIAIISQYHL